MDANHLRAWLLTLPRVVETMQWGANLVFWVGDKAIGGKMFALINLDEPKPSQNLGAPQSLGAPFMQHHRVSGSKPHPILSYAADPARYFDLLELEGLIPAPYLARAHWVAALHWNVFNTAEWRDELRAAHALTLAKLPKKVVAALAAPSPMRVSRKSTSPQR